MYVLQNVLKIKPMAGLCRPLNTLACCRGNIDKGMHGEKSTQVNCCPCQTVALSPCHGFAVGMSVMTLGATYAYDGETDALGNGGGNDARDFHMCFLSGMMQQNR